MYTLIEKNWSRLIICDTFSIFLYHTAYTATTAAAAVYLETVCCRVRCSLYRIYSRHPDASSKYHMRICKYLRDSAGRRISTDAAGPGAKVGG